jgi:hypothetical protein
MIKEYQPQVNQDACLSPKNSRLRIDAVDCSAKFSNIKEVLHEDFDAKKKMGDPQNKLDELKEELRK